MAPPPAEVAHAILEAHWRPEGYCVPNAATYPYQWLWDSCFHSVAWAALGEGDRARRELLHVFRTQDESGFVPHVDYEADPEALDWFWQREGSSSITQPPLYGHAVAELVRRGVAVPEELVDRARRGLDFLVRHRRRDRASWLVTLVHPWESGADDSPRWDDWYPDGRFDPSAGYALKGDLMAPVQRGRHGEPLANPAFEAASAGFNALVAFDALEVVELTGDDHLADEAGELVEALDERWDADARTWVDGGSAAEGSGRCRTLDALLPVLVSRRPAAVAAAFADLVDTSAHGAPCGPTGVHRGEPAFEPRTYWRGPAWPQLTYLLWVAARRRGDEAVTAELAGALVRGAEESGWAEYWDPDTGTGLGAAPQSWTALAAVVGAG